MDKLIYVPLGDEPDPVETVFNEFYEKLARLYEKETSPEKIIQIGQKTGAKNTPE